MEDTYKTIENPSEGLFKDKGSKFLSFAFPVTSESEVKAIVDKIKKEYFDARHHCYAYILGQEKEKRTFRAQDDGEPSGTAGRPIYGQLLSADLTNILVVVVRYFGGILLGTSGLINAYKTASKEAIANALIVERTIDVDFEVKFEYVQMNDVMRILKDFSLVPRNQQYDLDCSLDFSVRSSLAERVERSFVDLRTVTITRK